jgi:fatty-acyl-CoA synthase
MRIIKLLIVLFKISPFGLFRLIAAIFKNGINLMALLEFSDRSYSEKVAIVDDSKTVSYRQLLAESERLSMFLFKKYRPRTVGLLCKNGFPLVRSLFAVSRLGADIYLLNTEMSEGQLKEQLEQQQFDLLIYDSELSGKVADYQGDKLASEDCLLEEADISGKLPRTSMGKLILLTGGTTGKPKEAAHKPSLFTYLIPFFGLLTRLKLLNYQTVYIATPIYHGFGVAVLFVFVALGKKILLSSGFETEKACRMIREHGVEVVTVVPLMLDRMLKKDPESLRSIACIASGSAPLNPKLVEEVFCKLGDVLYNLYGTSETGLNIIGTPEDLKYSSKTLGRGIMGVRLQVVDRNKSSVAAGSIGQFCVDSVGTGDMGYRDRKGYYFLCGRMDDMIVSGGVNVYPADIEQVLTRHPLVEEVAVIGVADVEFGQRLKAFVQLIQGAAATDGELLEWLRGRVARFQMPKEIVFVEEMPYTHLGKVDKKKLS